MLWWLPNPLDEHVVAVMARLTAEAELLAAMEGGAARGSLGGYRRHGEQEGRIGVG